MGDLKSLRMIRYADHFLNPSVWLWFSRWSSDSYGPVIFPTPPDATALVLELQGIRKVLGVIQTQAQPEIFW